MYKTCEYSLLFFYLVGCLRLRREKLMCFYGRHKVSYKSPNQSIFTAQNSTL